MRIEIDKTSDAPLYLQLAQSITESIGSGRLQPGEKLPTVRELADETGMSAGTIRHAYDALTRSGALYMVQGKGTFVRDQARASSREMQAMEAIGSLLDRLFRLGFTAREASLFFELCLRNREEQRPLIPVALVDCNPEALGEAARQLSTIPGIELTEYLLADIQRAPAELLAPYPLIITTQTHYHELCALAKERESAIFKVVLSPSQSTVIELARVEAGSGIGIFCQTQRFAQIIRAGMRTIPHLRPSSVVAIYAGGADKLSGFLQGLRALVVAPDYLSYASLEDQRALRDFTEAGGRVIPYHHQIDQGSQMYIEDKIKSLAT